MKNFDFESLKKQAKDAMNQLKKRAKKATLGQIVYYGTIPFFGVITLIIALLAPNADHGIGGGLLIHSLSKMTFFLIALAIIITIFNGRKNEDKALLVSDISADKLKKAVMFVFKGYRKAIIVALILAVVFTIFIFFVIALKYGGYAENFIHIWNFFIDRLLSTRGAGMLWLLWLDFTVISTTIVLLIKSFTWAENFNKVCKT